MEDQREVGSLARGVMLPQEAQPLSGRLPSGIGFLPLPLPPALSAPLTVGFPHCPKTVRRTGRFTTFRAFDIGRIRLSLSAGWVGCPRAGIRQPRRPQQCLLAPACQPLWPIQFITTFKREFTWVSHPVRPWPRTARGWQLRPRLTVRTPPDGVGYVVGGLAISLRYGWWNTRSRPATPRRDNRTCDLVSRIEHGGSASRSASGSRRSRRGSRACAGRPASLR